MKSLGEHIQKLDQEYDTLNDEMAKGHSENFGAGWVTKLCAVVGSTELQLESKELIDIVALAFSNLGGGKVPMTK